MQVSTNRFRNGLKIELDGEPFIIVEFLHVKPGKGGAFVRTKLKNLKSGAVLERTFRAGEKLELPDLEERNTQFLYKSGDQYCFMDNSTYEQIFLMSDQVRDKKDFLTENLQVDILFHNGAPIDMTLPIFVEAEVADTEPGVRGDTASGGSKPAVLVTGGVVQTPLFINAGDVIKIDTRTGEYIERVR